MNQLYQSAGISKQAVSQQASRQARFERQISELIEQADLLRRDHPGCGVEKMYHTLKPDFLGRDRFIELFMGAGFRLKRSRNYRRTTYACHINYPNLIKGVSVGAPSVIWQSDITYYQAGDRFYYAVFIIDVYTKKIVGYQVSDHMRTTANVKALQMALKNNKAPDIHHSDRGSQYSSHEYTNLLNSHNCRISMAQTAQDNAYAERINRTIKEEYLAHWVPGNLQKLKQATDKAVFNYNTKRKHKHLKMMAPVDFENCWHKNLLSEKPIITIFNENFI
ncbi:MAG: IS3 family transposase [Dinghuibacter sp.]|nr:IS3 family transposase [Dinghuibacter sp.]